MHRAAAVLSVVLAILSVAAALPETAERKQLLNSAEFPAGWMHFSAGEDARIGDTWRVEETTVDGIVLICSGQPYGYIRTATQYADFEFGLEWRYPTAENGNSGVLVHTSGEDKIWPTALQVQLHTPSAGSILPTGGASPKTPVRVKDLSRPVNEWNSCILTCRGGRLSVVINNTQAGEIEGCVPDSGCIALQSEGSEIHFRKIWMRKLPAAEANVE